MRLFAKHCLLLIVVLLNDQIGNAADITPPLSWVATDPSMGHLVGVSGQAGPWVSKPGTWTAVVANDNKPNFLSFGPYVSIKKTGDYTAYWDLDIDSNAAGSKSVLKLDVIAARLKDGISPRVLAEREVLANEFSPGSSRRFYLSFNVDKETTDLQLEFRIFWRGVAAVQLSTIGVSNAISASKEFTYACSNIIGTTPTKDSSCGCGTVNGFTGTGAVCGHVCVQLPSNKSDADFILAPFASRNSNSFRPCGDIGDCAVDWSRYEGREYYKDTNQICGRFKSWDNGSKLVFKIVVTEK